MESTASNTVRVFHLTGETPEGRSLLSEITFSEDLVADATRYWTAGNYKHVADVSVSLTSDDGRLDEAFQSTNTIERVWKDNTEVLPRFEGPGCRSTSVGDIVVLRNGRRFVCAPFGWAELEAV